MKTIMVFILGLLFSVGAESQVMVNGKDINKMPELKYVRLWPGNGTKGSLDIGEKKMSPIEDETGSTKKFNSEVDILNFLYKNGWEVVTGFMHPPSIREYLLKRKE